MGNDIEIRVRISDQTQAGRASIDRAMRSLRTAANRNLRFTATIDNNTAPGIAAVRTAIGTLQALSPVRLRVDLDGDTGGLAAATLALRQIGARGNVAAGSMHRLNDGAQDASRALRTLRGRANAAADALRDLRDTSTGVSASLRTLATRLGTAGTRLNDVDDRARTLRGDMDHLGGSVDGVGGALGELRGGLRLVGDSAGRASSALGGSGMGLKGQVIAVAAAIGTTMLPAIGALSPMLFGMAGVAGGAALAYKGIGAEVKKLKPALEGLQKVSTSAVMPGVKEAVGDVGVAMKQLHPVVKIGGEAFGDFAREAGKFAKSPAFQDALLKNVRLGSVWFKEFGSSVLTFTQSFLDFGAKSKPTLDALGGGLNSIFSQGLPDMFAGLEKGVGGSAAAFDGLFEGVNKTLGAMGRLSGAMANSLGPVVGAIFRRFGELAEAAEVLLAPALDVLAPTFRSLVDVMGLSDGATKSLAEGIGKVLAGAARVVAVPLKNLFDFMAITLPLVRDLASAVAGPLVSAFLGVTGARDGIDGMSNSLNGWSNWVKNNRESIASAFRSINLAVMEVVMYAVENIPLVYDAWAAMVSSSLAVLDTLVQGASHALGWIPGLGSTISKAADNFSAFRTTVDGSMKVAGDRIRDFSNMAGPRLRENYLRMNIDNWNAQIAQAKRLLSNKNLPAEKRARLLADKRDLEAKVAAAKRDLLSIDGRTARTYITTVYRKLDEGMSTAFSGRAHGGIIGAAGGGPRSRMTLVGEQGPELVDLAPGSRVRSNPDSRRIAASWGASEGTQQPIELVINIDGREVARQLWDPMRAEVWSRAGGDVQKALGR